MKEKDFQTLFTKWIRRNLYPYSAVWELKICHSSALPFSRVEDHQITALKHAIQKCRYHKISDQSLGQKPFDAFQICNSPAFVVILYYKPRQPKVMYWINVLVFEEEKRKSKRKSLTEERAKQIALETFTL